MLFVLLSWKNHSLNKNVNLPVVHLLANIYFTVLFLGMFYHINPLRLDLLNIYSNNISIDIICNKFTLWEIKLF